ncbi:dihydroorotase [Psychroflexus sp. YR1-1]|uniref:Dihydroorotase n=1 Tax=Psychroflexus aurantiacus TaxID=2709310 RepID=A0A6B3R0U1_9FLAO|nr:dihydroorotase [Psychroflexus aurantiacus]NEV94223.1 dihydroorotase [Psychroflexus aurantiacus]
MSSFLLKSAKILDPESSYHLQTKDILVEDGVITKIEDSLLNADQILSFKNLHVSCGFFDSSVSFGEPGFEERETLANGVITARKSGFTSFLLNPNLNPVTDTNSAVKFLQQQIDPQLIDIKPLGALTKGFDGKNLAELYDMQMAGAVGFYDFKTPVADANLFKIALQYMKSFEGLLFSYPQDKYIAGRAQVNEDEFTTYIGLKGIPNLAEELQIARDLYILEYTGGKLHIPNLSTKASVELIKKAKAKGLQVTCSVALPHVFFTSDMLESFDSKYKILPPLRTQKDTEALKNAVKDGVIDMLTCDHEPMDEEHKALEFENASYGSIGLESAFSVVNTLFGAEKASELLTKPKTNFGLQTSKIDLKQRADLSLFDPDSEYTFQKQHIFSKTKNSIFLGESLKGKVFGSIYNDSFYEN